MPVLEGYLLPENGNTEDDTGSGDEDDTATSEMLDMEEMFDPSSGNLGHQAHPPARRKVRFMTFHGETLSVTGCFALRAPWWHITCNAQGSGETWTVKGAPSYKIRTDLDKDGWIPILSLFLVACNVPDYYITEFIQWLPTDRYVDLNNILDILVLQSLLDSDSEIPQRIIQYVSSSVEGRRVNASFLCPNVMKYLPVLLPRHFLNLLDRNEDEVECLLSKLEDIIEEDVWKLGFSKVMSEELGLQRCEAQLQAFKDCGLLETMPRLQQVALWAYDEVKKSCSKTGSTYMEKDQLCDILRKKLGIPDDHVWETLPFLRDCGAVVLHKQRVALQNLHSYEVGIADSLCCLMSAAPWKIRINAEEVLRTAAEERRAAKGLVTALDPPLPPAAVDPFQLKAAEMICANPVTVISGKGGCGKTTLVSLVFQAAVPQEFSVSEEDGGYEGEPWEEPGRGGLTGRPWPDPGGEPRGDPGEHPGGGGHGGHDGGCIGGGQPGEEEEMEEGMETQRDKLLKESILLTAPTGRAASLLTRKTGFAAYTLHQVIWKFKSSPEVEGVKQWPFREVRVLVVDEGSMVPVGLLHSVLSLLIQHAKLQKFVLLGDVRQLPSIQPGNTLQDLFHSLKGFTLEMMNNHRSESQLIVQNAQLIADIGSRRRTGPLNFDLIVDLRGPFSVPLAKKFIHIRLPEDRRDDDLQMAVKRLIGSAPGLDDDSTSQFIAFRRVDVALINELCCVRYNRHTTKNHEKKLDFQVGDKVCVTKNAFVVDAAAPKKPDHDETGDCEDGDVKDGDVKDGDCEDGDGKDGDRKDGDGKIRLCNGEIFFITQDNTYLDRRGRRKGVLTLDDRLGRIVKANYQELLRGCKLRHAWARTIHTFQGSESETVVYVLGAGAGQSWRHVYTAVTRGQKRVYVVSTDVALNRALQWRETRRLTRLAGLVKEQVVQTLPSTPSRQQGTPLKTTPMMTTPLKTTPMMTTPLKTTPMMTTPLKTTPMMTTPLKTTSMMTTPLKTMSMMTTPLKTTPMMTTPLKTTPLTTTPLKTTPLTTTPLKLSPQIAAGATPGWTQATPVPWKITPRRLWKAEGPEGDPQSWPTAWGNQGEEQATSETDQERGPPPKRTKFNFPLEYVRWLCLGSPGGPLKPSGENKDQPNSVD